MAEPGFPRVNTALKRDYICLDGKNSSVPEWSQRADLTCLYMGGGAVTDKISSK